jgi:hypothetical protein
MAKSKENPTTTISQADDTGIKPELKPITETETEADPLIEAISTQAAPEDAFDLDKLRLDQSFVESAGVKKLLTTIPVRKPNPQDFVRVHPGTKFRAAMAMIEFKEEREIYLLPPPLARELPGEFVMAVMYTTINRQGVLSIWPVRLPAPDGRINEWHRSAAEAAELAMKRWVRVKANMALGAYEMFEAASSIPNPTWPALAARPSSPPILPVDRTAP